MSRVQRGLTPRDFQEEDEQKMAVMRKAFQMFDTTKSGFIDTLKISTILNTMGQLFDDSELNALIQENDPDGTGKVNFDVFCRIAGRFLEEEDAEAMQEELKEAFRLYDREGNGYITTATLKEILAALDDKLTSADLDGIIAEIDTDGSGTVDFDGAYTCLSTRNPFPFWNLPMDRWQASTLGSWTLVLRFLPVLVDCGNSRIHRS